MGKRLLFHSLALALLVPALALAQPGSATSDPDGLKGLTSGWQKRGDGGTTPTTETTSGRYKAGQLVKLTPKDKPTELVVWDVPDELKDDHHIDDATTTLVLTSAKTGKYRIVAWTCEIVPPPKMPGADEGLKAPVGRYRPKLLQAWTIEFEGGQASPGTPGTPGTPPAPALGVKAAFKQDMLEPANKEAGEKLKAKVAELLKKAERGGWQTVGDVRDEIAEAAKSLTTGKLTATLAAIRQDVNADRALNAFGEAIPFKKPNVQAAYVNALRRIADALGP